MSGGHGAGGSSNKRVALLISVLALFLALAETLAKGAQTDALGANVEASNQWAYFQARTIRGTVLKTADETLALLPPDAANSRGDQGQARRVGQDHGPLGQRARHRRGAQGTGREGAALAGDARPRPAPLPPLRVRPRPPSRSASCSPRRRSSPASSPWWSAAGSWVLPGSLCSASASTPRTPCRSSTEASRPVARRGGREDSAWRAGRALSASASPWRGPPAAGPRPWRRPASGAGVAARGRSRRRSGGRLAAGGGRGAPASSERMRQGDALAARVHLHHAHLHHVARLHHLARVLHEAVGQHRDVHQPVLVHADIHEGAEGGDVGDHAFEPHAGLQVARSSRRPPGRSRSGRPGADRGRASPAPTRMSVTVGRPKVASVKVLRVQAAQGAALLPISAWIGWPVAARIFGAPPDRPPGARPRRRGDRCRRGCAGSRRRARRPWARAPPPSSGWRGCGTGRWRRGARRCCAATRAVSPETRASSGAEAVFTSTPTPFTQSSTTASRERDELPLGQIVLVLADADRLRLDLHELGQRVLQAPGDGDGAADRDVEARAAPRWHRPRPSRPRRRPPRPSPW